MQDDQRLSWIDVCRAGSDDLADESMRELADALQNDPELRSLFQRVQSLDSRIAVALRQVAIPEGLSERILARLACQREASAADKPDLPRPTAADEEVVGSLPAVKRRRQIGRRALLAGLAAAAAVAAAVLLSRPSAPHLTEESIATAARELFTQGEFRGELVRVVSPPAGFPMSAAMLALPDARWHRLESFLGRTGVAYELRRAGARAALYVVRFAAIAGKPKIALANLPLAPRPSSTGGLTTAVWREQGLLYVLVVEGTEAEYRQFLARSPVVA
jgi:hypothetical protein